jgi:hypothetical protein
MHSTCQFTPFSWLQDTTEEEEEEEQESDQTEQEEEEDEEGEEGEEDSPEKPKPIPGSVARARSEALKLKQELKTLAANRHREVDKLTEAKVRVPYCRRPIVMESANRTECQVRRHNCSLLQQCRLAG